MLEKVEHSYAGDHTWELECDDCGEVEEIEGSFEDCLEFIKDEGWRARKIAGVREHKCPECISNSRFGQEDGE